MVTIGHNILIICNLVTLLIKIIISVVCDLSHKTRQVTSEKKRWKQMYQSLQKRMLDFYKPTYQTE